MPPRLPNRSLTSPLPPSSSPSPRCLRPHDSPSSSPSSCLAFSSSALLAAPAEIHPKRTSHRHKFLGWLNGPMGRALKDPLPGSTNYLGAYNEQGKLRRLLLSGNREKAGLAAKAADGDDAGNSTSVDAFLSGSRTGELPPERPRDLQPFPRNENFTSQNVLANDVKDAIYEDVVASGKLTVREASEKYKVDMRRIGAVVRLKEVEKRWKAEGKPLATPYEQAVHAMLPKTTLHSKAAHESINDLAVHEATRAQLFHPVSESRRFTRADAGAVFADGLKPADSRIPHPEMILKHRGDAGPGLSQDVYEREQQVARKFRAADAHAERYANRRERERRENTTVVQSGRWEWRFEDVKIEKDSVGHFAKGIGSRYGVPAQDRKKGQVKIPRRVDG